MYPNGFELMKIELDGLDSVMEGEFRPGHFDGVVTIVSRFFKLIKPNKSYFGEKDYQQLLVVKKVASSISREIEIVPCEIQREDNGLAMSSRNRRLTKQERELAKNLNEVLFSLRKKLKFMSLDSLEKDAKVELASQVGINLEYLKIVNEFSLRPEIGGSKSNLRAFVAAEIGGIRLIDNMRL
jgi:pantoate--beta-alanine ligase